MSMMLALQHVLSSPVPREVAACPAFARELRGRMRLAALRWQAALDLGFRELAEDCLANAIQWRNAAQDCESISLRGTYGPAQEGAPTRPNPGGVPATIPSRRYFQ